MHLFKPCRQAAALYNTLLSQPATLCSVQAERYAAGVKRFDFDAGLGPYDLHRFAQWQRLAGFISDGEKRASCSTGGGSINCCLLPTLVVLQDCVERTPQPVQIHYTG